MAEHSQRELMVWGKLSRHAVDHAQTSQCVAFRADERRAGVEANVRITEHQWVGRKTIVDQSIGDHEQVWLSDRVGAKSEVSCRFRNRDSDARFEPLPMLVEER